MHLVNNNSPLLSYLLENPQVKLPYPHKYFYISKLATLILQIKSNPQVSPELPFSFQTNEVSFEKFVSDPKCRNYYLYFMHYRSQSNQEHVLSQLEHFIDEIEDSSVLFDIAQIALASARAPSQYPVIEAVIRSKAFDPYHLESLKSQLEARLGDQNH